MQRPRKHRTPRETLMGRLTSALFEARKARKQDPDGTFDKKGRWYPSTLEDAGGSGSSVRAPSKWYPYSYMLRCRTKLHCAALVQRLLHGEPVPTPVVTLLLAEIGVKAPRGLDAKYHYLFPRLAALEPVEMQFFNEISSDAQRRLLESWIHPEDRT